MYQAILFDFDGVLVNSLEYVWKAVCDVLKADGLEPLSFEEFYRGFPGPPYEPYFRSLGVRASMVEISQIYYSSEAEMYRAPLFKEVSGVLRELSKKGLFLGIVSARPTDRIQEVLRHGRIVRRFAVVRGYAEEKIWAIRSICIRNVLNLEKVLFVGDRPSDVRDGWAAGVKTALYNPHFVVDWEADHRLERLSDLLGLVESNPVP